MTVATTGRQLKIVFMGTPQFAATSLERLLANSGEAYTVVGVVTAPDQPRGRGLAVTPTPVARTAEKYGVTVLKPTTVRDQAFNEQLRALAPDLLVVVAYGKILPKEVLEIPAVMPINVHASLLPRHRGASPIEATILAGDRETGITIIRMTEKMDAGPIIAKKTIAVKPDDTQGSLKERLAELAAQTLDQVVRAIRDGEVNETPQDESRATYCRPIKKEDSWIDWSRSCIYIERMLRAFDPWPIARSKLRGEEILIFRGEALPEHTCQQPPGTLIAVSPEPVVACGEGALKLVEVQLPGKKRIKGSDLTHGRHLKVGERLGS